MLVVRALCDGLRMVCDDLRMVCDEWDELRESDRESMVVCAPSSSRNPVEPPPGDPFCTLPSRVLEDRFKIGRGLASMLCLSSAAELRLEVVVSS